MAEWICEQCGLGFTRERNVLRKGRFCGQPCYHAWRKANGITIGQFKKGQVAWNKGAEGLRMSPATEFKKGHRPVNWVEVGAVRIRTCKRGGKRRAWIKVAEPRKWLLRATYVWCRAYGELPKGLIVHHIDRDTLNDSLVNLAAISRAAHIKEHRPEFEEKRIAGMFSRKRNPR